MDPAGACDVERSSVRGGCQRLRTDRQANFQLFLHGGDRQFLFPREETPDDAYSQDGHDATQAPQSGHVVGLRLPRNVDETENPVETTHEHLARDQHLQADTRQDERQPLVELGEGVLDGIEQKVERLQAQQCHDVTGDDHERIASHRQNRRNRVDGEHDVDTTEHDDGDTEGCQLETALLPGRVGRAVAVLGHRQDLRENAVDLVLFEDKCLVVVARLELDPGVDQEHRQDDRHDREPLDGSDANRDERDTQDDRHHHAPEKQRVMVALEEHERRDHQRPHEDVVERQRVLHEVTGVVLLPGDSAVQQPDCGAEHDTHAEPQQRLQGRSLE